MRTVIGLLVVAVAACSSNSDARRVEARDAARLLIDRNWLDRWPQDKDDHLQVYRFVPSMGGGVYQDRTLFKGTFELFQFAAGEHQIAFTFPHDGQKLTARYRIEHVRGPAPFDLKLTIAPDPRGPGTYYGMTSDHGLELEAMIRHRR